MDNKQIKAPKLEVLRTKVILLFSLAGFLSFACGAKVDSETAFQQAISAIRSIAGDPLHPNAQGQAVEALGILKDTSDLPRLGDVLMHGRDDLSFKAAKAIGQIGGSEAIDLLKGVKDSLNNPMVRAQVLVSLHKMGDNLAVEELKTGSTTKDPMWKSSAISALGKVGYIPAVDHFVEILRKDENFLLRSSAATALGRLRAESATRALAEAVRKDKEEIVCVASVGALARIGTPAAISALEDALVEDPNFQIRSSIIDNLEKLKGGQRIFPMVRSRFAKRGDKFDRYLAAEAIGRLGDKEAIPLLKSVLRADPSPEIKLIAAQALVRLEGSSSAFARIENILTEDNKKALRVRAAEILSDYPEPSTLLLFKRLVTKDRESDVRVAAAQALGRIGVPGGIVALEIALKYDTHELVRMTAVGALGSISHDKAEALVSEALLDLSQTGEVRAAAARALRTRSSSDAIGPLFEALKDPDPFVRLEAAIGVIRLTKGIEIGGKIEDPEV